VGLQVAVESKAEGQVTLRFAVRDTGIGIAPEKQQMIFDVFSQVDSSMAREFGGNRDGTDDFLMAGGDDERPHLVGNANWAVAVSSISSSDPELRLAASPLPVAVRASRRNAIGF
jgi:hypothetical protein